MSQHAIADGLLFTYTCPAAWSVYAAFIKRHQLLHALWGVPDRGFSLADKYGRRRVEQHELAELSLVCIHEDQKLGDLT